MFSGGDLSECECVEIFIWVFTIFVFFFWVPRGSSTSSHNAGFLHIVPICVILNGGAPQHFEHYRQSILFDRDEHSQCDTGT